MGKARSASLSPSIQVDTSLLDYTNLDANTDAIADLFSVQPASLAVSVPKATAPTVVAPSPGGNGAVSGSSSLGSKASQSFSKSENATGGEGDGSSTSSKSNVAAGTGDTGEALDSIGGKLNTASNVLGFASNFASGLAPISGLLDLASSGVNGLKAIDNLTTQTQTPLSTVKNVTDLLGVASMFNPSLAPLALGGKVAVGAYESYKDGLLGDMMGTRNNEDVRDRLENRGFSREDTGYMDSIDSWNDSTGGDLSGGARENDTLGRAADGAFSSNTESTVGSRLGAAAGDVFGGSSGWGSSRSGGGEGGGGGGNNVGGDRGSSTGTGGGYNDGHGGVSGL